MAEALDPLRIPRHEIDFLSGGGFKGLGQMFKLVDRKRFDIVHAHLSRASYMSWLAERVKHVPLICSAHVETREPVFKFASKRRNRVIAVSEYVKEFMVQNGEVPADRIDVVHNGTPFADATYESGQSVADELGIPADAPMIALVARVAPEKGHDLAVEAMAKVHAKHPEAHLLFVGRCEDGIEETLGTRIRELGLESVIHFTGNRNDVARLVDAMTFTILPSNIESCSLVAMESMARERPVVASNVGGLKEVIADGKTGILVEKDADKLAQGMIRLLDNPSLVQTMGTAGRQRVLDNFTMERMIEKVEKVYERALA